MWLVASAGTSTQVVDSIFVFFIALCVLLLLLITGLMVLFVYKYRRTKHPKAEQIEGNFLLEVIWTAVPTLLVLCMFYWGWMGYRYLRVVPRDHMTVQVTASKWAWMFEYENGKRSNELHVPVERPVKLLMKSRDVLHSFFVPAFRVKQDLLPGVETYLWFEASRTGTFDLLCTEYCGERHSYMLSKVIALPEEEFEVWYATESEDPPGLQALKNAACLSCHSLDGSPLVGPTFQGIWGREEMLVDSQGETRRIRVDEEYLRRSILEPQVELVQGYPPSMPMPTDILDAEQIDAIVEYLKTVE